MSAGQDEPRAQPATFVGGAVGPWEVADVRTLRGPALEPALRLAIHPGPAAAPAAGHAWALRGVASNLRYTTAGELKLLRARQPPLGRAEARLGALIPIRKCAAWWELAQDERRALMEETSRHTAIGLEYLPQIARKLFHSRDLGEPFDFLTWFEFAPEHEPLFDELLARLRASAEWRWVEREVDVRVTRPA